MFKQCNWELWMDWLMLCSVRRCWLVSAFQVSFSHRLFSLCFILPVFQKIIFVCVYIYIYICVFFLNWLIIFLKPIWNILFFFCTFFLSFCLLNVIVGCLILGNVGYTPSNDPCSFSLSNTHRESVWWLFCLLHSRFVGLQRPHEQNKDMLELMRQSQCKTWINS